MRDLRLNLRLSEEEVVETVATHLAVEALVEELFAALEETAFVVKI